MTRRVDITDGPINQPYEEVHRTPLPRRPVTIAIDFDCTYTADRALWQAFIVGATRVGHRIVCVTARKNSAANRKLVTDSFGPVYRLLAGVVFADHSPKRRAASIAGFRVDIWIDDIPEVIGAATREEVAHWERRFPHKETLPMVENE